MLVITLGLRPSLGYESDLAIVGLSPSYWDNIRKVTDLPHIKRRSRDLNLDKVGRILLKNRERFSFCNFCRTLSFAYRASLSRNCSQVDAHLRPGEEG